MGGKTWSRDEEVFFWRVIVPRSPKAVIQTPDVLDWAKCAQLMQKHFGNEARREYTKLMLFEHYFQNVKTGHKSPKAIDLVVEHKKQLEARSSRLPPAAAGRMEEEKEEGSGQAAGRKRNFAKDNEYVDDQGPPNIKRVYRSLRSAKVAAEAIPPLAVNRLVQFSRRRSEGGAPTSSAAAQAAGIGRDFTPSRQEVDGYASEGSTISTAGNGKRSGQGVDGLGNVRRRYGLRRRPGLGKLRPIYGAGGTPTTDRRQGVEE